MTNNFTIIQLRNTAILWIVMACVCLGGIWWAYGFFAKIHSDLTHNIQTLSQEVRLLKQEGVTTKKDWDTLSADERDTERWNTIASLVPSMKSVIGIGTPAGNKNLITLKKITRKIGDMLYQDWLIASWTKDIQSALEMIQRDIAEIIPVFAGNQERSNTQPIQGKITMKTLVEYIQRSIVDQYGLGNALGNIGIDRVVFSEETPEIGIYEVPLRFENVENTAILQLLDFLGKTGGVRIASVDGTLQIQHTGAKRVRGDDSASLSSLKNLLITTKQATIRPARGTDKTPETLTSDSQQLWDVDITLEFYIRGASKDHIGEIDRQLTRSIGLDGKGSLISDAQKLLKQCDNCPEASKIRDIISLLTQASSIYGSITTQERNPKNTSTPLEMIQARTEISTAVETLSKKLDTIRPLISTK